jgi:hypothetical protein
VTGGANPDVEKRFEVLEVLVVAAEQGFDAFVGDGNLADDGRGRDN